MPIDSSIYFQQQSPDIFGSIEKGLRLGDLIKQNRFQDQQRAEEQGLKDAYQKNMSTGPDGSVALNQKGVLSDLAKVNPMKAMEAEKQFSAQSKEAEAQKFDMQKRRTDAMHGLMWSVTPENYQAKIQEGKKTGLISDGEFPAQYDPGFMKRVQMATLSAKDQLAQQQLGITNSREDAKLALERQKISEGKKAEEKNIPQNVYAAATYGQRLQDANKQMNSIMSNGFDPTSITAGIASSKFFPDRLMGNDSKLMEQSKRNFINAVLRRESGSAISDSEFLSGDKQYFPTGGDTPEVLTQKERNREVAIAGLMAEGEKAHGKLNKYLPPDASAVAARPQPGQRGGDPLNPMAYADSNSFAPDILNYAKTHGISPQQAQVVKMQRTGGK